MGNLDGRIVLIAPARKGENVGPEDGWQLG